MRTISGGQVIQIFLQGVAKETKLRCLEQSESQRL